MARGMTNPAGRPRGSRNKLSEAFLQDFYEVWLEEGEQALRTAARKSPARFIAVAASLIPQHFKLEHEHKALHLTEEQVERRLLELAALIHDEADTGGDGGADSGEDSPPPAH